MIEEIVKTLNIEDVKKFVIAVNNIVSQLLVQPTQTGPVDNAPIDYNAKQMPDYKPKGGWINVDELRNKNQQMTEAISLEKWTDGFIFALQALAAVGMI